jgi:hypothetical protein
LDVERPSPHERETSSPWGIGLQAPGGVASNRVQSGTHRSRRRHHPMARPQAYGEGAPVDALPGEPRGQGLGARRPAEGFFHGSGAAQEGAGRMVPWIVAGWRPGAFCQSSGKTCLESRPRSGPKRRYGLLEDG